MSGISESELLKLIYCCSILEERVSEAYEHMAERAEDQLLRAVLSYVASDSRKHAEALRSIALALGTEVRGLEECERVAGELWATTMRGVERELEQSGRLSRKDLERVVESLADLESAVMEEYLMMLQAEAMKMLLESRREAELLRMILQWIAEDEKRHAQIIESLKSG